MALNPIIPKITVLNKLHQNELEREIKELQEIKESKESKESKEKKVPQDNEQKETAYVNTEEKQILETHSNEPHQVKPPEPTNNNVNINSTNQTNVIIGANKNDMNVAYNVVVYENKAQVKQQTQVNSQEPNIKLSEVKLEIIAELSEKKTENISKRTTDNVYSRNPVALDKNSIVGKETEINSMTHHRQSSKGRESSEIENKGMYIEI